MAVLQTAQPNLSISFGVERYRVFQPLHYLEYLIVWCDWEDDDRDVIVEEEAQLRERVLSRCTQEWQHFTDLAEQLDEVPWDMSIERAGILRSKAIYCLKGLMNSRVSLNWRNSESDEHSTESAAVSQAPVLRGRLTLP